MGTLTSFVGRHAPLVLILLAIAALAFVVGRQHQEEPGRPKAPVFIVRAQGEVWRTEGFAVMPGGIQFVDLSGRRVSVVGSFSLSDR